MARPRLLATIASVLATIASVLATIAGGERAAEENRLDLRASRPRRREERLALLIPVARATRIGICFALVPNTSGQPITESLLPSDACLAQRCCYTVLVLKTVRSQRSIRCTTRSLP